ncbi:MAG: ribulose-phosphate 3-epimerase [Balneolaceae bacterium]|nr:ribulose-phosphate 3-epimerase [Balneolaceae bacterium]MBO6546990.1 ribulose-phosphate 3-epimerase [Balneolaceae bacterium]MBO6649350.1 ribulose-phosphate 3-epimerase [Balneolaceae bacterium]
MNFNLPVLAPSILAADFTNLESDVKAALKGGANWIHCDIMDGHFVPNISFGPNVVKQLSKVAPDAFIDSHLMIENPDQYIDLFVEAGSELISVHYEVCNHLHRTVQKIKSHGIMAGVAINPATSLHNIEPVLGDIDMVVLMSVNPGFGGQSFIEDSYDRLRELSDIRESGEYGFLIQVDGGVNLKNITKVAKAGADILVAGSAVFSAKDISARVNELQEKLSA